MHSTMTMALEAEERDEGEGRAARLHRKRQHEGVAMGGGQQQQPRHGDGNDEKVDRHQIGREQPGGTADFIARGVLHRGDVELPRQQDDGEGGEQRHGQPLPAVEPARKQVPDGGFRRRTLEEGADAAHDAEDHEGANRQERQELHQRFDGNCQDHAVLVFGGVDMPRAEENGEDPHGEDDEQRQAVEPGRRPENVA
jgi:hypothetical protein